MDPGGVTVDETHDAMDVLTERPHPYPRWMATAGWADFAPGIAILLGGSEPVGPRHDPSRGAGMA